MRTHPQAERWAAQNLNCQGYTTYLPLTTNTWYNTWVAPFQNQISSNMESCASPGMFFSVTTDGDITAAMQALFAQAISTARLTR